MFNGKWTYETGEEIPEVLGSGSRYYFVYETLDFEEALKKAHEGSRNYLLRKQYIPGKDIVSEYYNFKNERMGATIM